MKQAFMAGILTIACGTAYARDACNDKVAVPHDRDTRTGCR